MINKKSINSILISTLLLYTFPTQTAQESTKSPLQKLKIKAAAFASHTSNIFSEFLKEPEERAADIIQTAIPVKSLQKIILEYYVGKLKYIKKIERARVINMNFINDDILELLDTDGTRSRYTFSSDTLHPERGWWFRDDLPFYCYRDLPIPQNLFHYDTSVYDWESVTLYIDTRYVNSEAISPNGRRKATVKFSEQWITNVKGRFGKDMDQAYYFANGDFSRKNVYLFESDDHKLATRLGIELEAPKKEI